MRSRILEIVENSFKYVRYDRFEVKVWNEIKISKIRVLEKRRLFIWKIDMGSVI